ncbi:MAG TPA: V-type ATP synthase subunit D [Desulfobacteraceae bacterium]|nr:V-type ATP synthase subunit D [Desulfobacteraceae bacterium]
MAKIDIPPTKSSLRRIKDDLSFAYAGFDLLNQKREILVMTIVRNINIIKRLEKEFQEALEELYNEYKSAAVDMGSDILSLKSHSEKRSYSMFVEYSKLMGLKIPGVNLQTKNIKKVSGFSGTTSSYDKVKEKSIQLLPLLARYATFTKSIFILSRELKKVQRRVNALDKIFIPQNEETKKYITDRLEEMEREEIFVKRLIEQRME